MGKFDVVVVSHFYGYEGHHVATDLLRGALEPHGLSPSLKDIGNLTDGTFMGFIFGEDAAMVKYDILKYCKDKMEEDGISGRVFVFVSENLEIGYMEYIEPQSLSSSDDGTDTQL